MRAFAALIAHHNRSCQTRHGVKLVYQFGGTTETWDINPEMLDGVTTVILLELAESHYTLTSFEKTTDGVTVVHLDGFQKGYRVVDIIMNRKRHPGICPIDGT